MKIEEIDKNKLSIKVTKSKIDNKLGVPEPFIDKPAVYLISGGMGTGKSSFINSIMTANGEHRVFKGRFDRVFYNTPEEVFSSEENHPFKHHPRVYHNLDQEFFNQVVEECATIKNEGGNCCLILDDWSEQLKDKYVLQNLKRIIYKQRHLKLNIIISVLTLKSMPRNLRSLLDIIILFKPKSMIETDNFAEEVFGLNKTEAKDLFSYIFDVPYNFIFYNQRNHSFYKNFNKLKLVED